MQKKVGWRVYLDCAHQHIDVSKSVRAVSTRQSRDDLRERGMISQKEVVRDVENRWAGRRRQSWPEEATPMLKVLLTAPSVGINHGTKMLYRERVDVFVDVWQTMAKDDREIYLHCQACLETTRHDSARQSDEPTIS